MKQIKLNIITKTEKYPIIIDGEVQLPNILDQKNNPKKNDIFIKFNEN